MKTIFVALICLSFFSFVSLKPDLTIGKKVFFTVGIKGKELGKIVFGLYTNQVPKTTRNFLELCTGVRGKSNIYIYIYMI